VEQNFVDLSLKSSLVYVDGNFALGRPIANSFLLVKGIKSDKDCDIKINPNPLGYDAISKPWLPGVVPSVAPYSLSDLHLEPLDPPIGAAEEKTDFKLLASYKSGYAVYLGTEATVIGLGSLLLDTGEPVKYLSFTAYPMRDDVKEPIVGFTNAAGKFQLPRLKPGKYKISAQVDGKEKTVIFVLPKNAVGIYSLGTMTLSGP